MSRAFLNSPTRVIAALKPKKLGRLCTGCRRRFYSKGIIKENDIVLLKKKGDDSANPILTKALRSTGKVSTSRGTIDHASIIGKGIRDVVSTNKNVEYRIHQPTLGDYVTLSPRIVTPVYPADANLIVSLLDLHPPKNLEDVDQSELLEPLEIFEAGTGHGSLTLHLARAIHGFNPPSSLSSPLQTPIESSLPEVESTVPTNGSPPELTPSVEDMNNIRELKAIKKAYEAYLPTRRAVVQTLDIALRHSKHAQSTIRNFRNGLYMHNIEFHVGTIDSYLSSRFSSQQKPTPFLAHTILDLPGPHTYLEILGQALKPNGSLIIFCPSITQIGTCVKVVRDKKLPFVLETVLELGAGVGVGGREWDVRAVKPRALLKAEAEAVKAGKDSDNVDEVEGVGHGGSHKTWGKTDGELVEVEVGSGSHDENGGNGWEMVCRPKVGGRVSGGGFLALFRRMAY